jgi:hypothetical protein
MSGFWSGVCATPKERSAVKREAAAVRRQNFTDADDILLFAIPHIGLAV